MKGNRGVGASTDLVGAPQVDPAVEHIRFMELLAFTLVLQTNAEVPV